MYTCTYKQVCICTVEFSRVPYFYPYTYTCICIYIYIYRNIYNGELSIVIYNAINMKMSMYLCICMYLFILMLNQLGQNPAP